MSRKAIIAIVVIVVLIIISIVSFLIYRNSKQSKAEAEQRLAALQQQLNSQPNMPADQKANLLGQIAQLLGNIQLPQYTPVANGTPGATPTPDVAPNGFPLKKNVSGMDLYNQAVQKAVNAKCGNKLKAIGMAPLVADGKFGPLTEKGVAACIGTTTVSWEQYKSLVIA